ncbi:hypothetical protein G6L30_08040 [Agrobacterium rhizogenes]|nr:hypothetical protein [Rhizobium rhizogenes]
MIYFAQNTNGGPIRIGCSTNVGLRQSSLGSWVCGGVEIISTIDGDFYRERILLELFKPLNVDRDWFRSDATMWKFLLEGPIGGNLDWLPLTQSEDRSEMRSRIIRLFGTLENAIQPLGYSVMFSLQTAINAGNASSYQLAAKVKLAEMFRDMSIPSYLRALHEVPSPEEVAA